MIAKLLKKIIKKIFDKALSFNYCFFLFFGGAITFLSSYKSNFFFFIYSFFQASLITILFIFLHHKIKSKFLKKTLIGISFFTLILYFINFILFGLMNTSLMFAVKIFFSGGMDNFLITFKAINFSAFTTSLIVLAFTLVPLIGILIYNLLNKLSRKKPLFIKQKHLLFSFSLILLFLF